MIREPLAIELLVTEDQRRTTPDNPAKFQDPLAPVILADGSCDAGPMFPLRNQAARDQSIHPENQWIADQTGHVAICSMADSRLRQHSRRMPPLPTCYLHKFQAAPDGGGMDRKNDEPANDANAATGAVGGNLKPEKFRA
jgi:hypothetical protein